MIDPDDKPELSTATLDELMSEIASRCEGAVIALCTLADDYSGELPVRTLFAGNRLCIRGLVADLADLSARKFDARENMEGDE